MNINLTITAEALENRYDEDNRVTITLAAAHRLAVGDRVALTTKDGSVYVAEVLDDEGDGRLWLEVL